MRRYCALLLIILSCSKEETTRQITPPSFSAQHIAFISRRISNSADWQLYIMNADGSNQRKLTEDLVTCAPPAISRDGSKVAFVTYEQLTYRIISMDLNGDNRKVLGSNNDYCGGLTWSPDNRRIAYVRSIVNSKVEIVIVDISSGNETIIGEKNYNSSPVFLDDRTLLFSSAEQGELAGIYSVHLISGETRRLTESSKAFGSPKVSPDGRKVAINGVDDEGSQIFTMNADGSNLRQLTFSVSPITFPGSPPDGNSEPSWSPDGEQIAYVSYAPNGSPDIFVMDADGHNKRQLTDEELRDESPSWSPDGSTILFSSNRSLSLSAKIYTMHPDGGNQKPLTQLAYEDVFPVYTR